MKGQRKIVDGDKVAEVVSMMSGIPLQKVSQDENEKLAFCNLHILRLLLIYCYILAIYTFK